MTFKSIFQVLPAALMAASLLLAGCNESPSAGGGAAKAASTPVSMAVVAADAQRVFGRLAA